MLFFVPLVFWGKCCENVEEFLKSIKHKAKVNGIESADFFDDLTAALKSAFRCTIQAEDLEIEVVIQGSIASLYDRLDLDDRKIKYDSYCCVQTILLNSSYGIQGNLRHVSIMPKV
ncbi:hypothetical protein PR048_011492 [Dryococelus australis]|uniref:Uncharacterized protein n=1 Tax=Dryococelus australis TaxID=614101 RepID=A0ABQ9HM83_9NEOP|nr:hypothetical protein PR048_011492 [Dryococelus australis]